MCFLFDLLYGAAQRAALRAMLLLGIPQEVAKKGTKGSGTPWHPAVRKKVATLSLCSSFRKNTHLQHLQAWLKESHAHLGAKDFAFPVGTGAPDRPFFSQG